MSQRVIALRGALCLAAVSGQSLTQVRAADNAGIYKPSLGDMMARVQLRHSKLWYAANLENWVLAQYELEQLVSNLGQVKQLYPNTPASDLTGTDKLTALLGDGIAAKDKQSLKLPSTN